MMCISPVSVPRPNGQGARDRITVPCSKCYACLARKRAEWAFRLSNELKASDTAFFFTLTYSDEYDKGTVSKRDIQLFIKRLRKGIAEAHKTSESEHLTPKGIIPPLSNRVPQIAEKGPKTGTYGSVKKEPKFRYFVTGEYGEKTNRPHYHGIFFNIPNIRGLFKYDSAFNLVNDAWGLGIVHVGEVTPASINYVAKYCITRHLPQVGVKMPPFSLMSTKPGIGDEYLKTMTNYHRSTMTPYGQGMDGIKVPLSRYYKDRLWTEKERAVLNQELLELSDENMQKEIARIEKRGENYYAYELGQKQQISSKINQITKNSKL